METCNISIKQINKIYDDLDSTYFKLIYPLGVVYFEIITGHPSINRRELVSNISQQLVDMSLKNGGKLLYTDFYNKPIDFVTDESVENIIGKKVAIPIMRLNNNMELNSFNKKFNPRQNIKARMISYKVFLDKLSINKLETIKLDFPTIPFIIYDGTLNTQVNELKEDLKHELIHSIDPLSTSRFGEARLINELIAEIGSYADKKNDINAVKIDPNFLRIYMEFFDQISPELLKILNYNDSNPLKIEIAKLLSDFFYNLSTKHKNSHIVRQLMRCKNFEDLYMILKSSF